MLAITNPPRRMHHAIARALLGVVQRSIGDKSRRINQRIVKAHVFRLRLIGAIAARIQV
ncbi:Uncharacterised protein [Salmonella enterica subsp. enterica serovar Bovismorbificans]|uniref:Transposase n=1 Tax=Salmonella enterica subsp. enterica serovar Bovismorbificans TaxID=58097 RepID=A0A655E7S5_SALET|nr:Uncharacterised protein [Salmonella enterica subsp. enterica serovar Bovismorbificans]